MIHENEVAMLLLGLIVLVLVIMYKSELKRVPFYKLLLAAYCILVVGFAAKILDEIYLETYLIVTKHLCYAVSSLLVAVWFWKVFDLREEN